MDVAAGVMASAFPADVKTTNSLIHESDLGEVKGKRVLPEG